MEMMLLVAIAGWCIVVGIHAYRRQRLGLIVRFTISVERFVASMQDAINALDELRDEFEQMKRRPLTPR